jgi:hypothetical protein
MLRDETGDVSSRSHADSCFGCLALWWVAHFQVGCGIVLYDQGWARSGKVSKLPLYERWCVAVS